MINFSACRKVFLSLFASLLGFGVEVPLTGSGVTEVEGLIIMDFSLEERNISMEREMGNNLISIFPH